MFCTALLLFPPYVSSTGLPTKATPPTVAPQRLLLRGNHSSRGFGCSHHFPWPYDGDIGRPSEYDFFRVQKLQTIEMSQMLR